MDDLTYLKGRTVLITGAAGTIGAELAARVLPHVKALRCFDHAESELFFLQQRLAPVRAISPQLGDIRDLDRLRFAMHGVDVVFHAAALKHVGIGEYNPFEVVQSNLVGLDNVIRASLDNDVERMIFTSSDKAVNPTNVMGASKMMGERLVTAANEVRGHRKTVFASVRFGNVIGSRGSVVPIFAEQLARGEAMTLTDREMTRYVMAISEAASLVLRAGARARGGEVFVGKMRALRIVDLAEAIANIVTPGRAPTLHETGARPGEKLYEELLAGDERPRALDLGDLLIVLPPSDSIFAGAPTAADFTGAKPVAKQWHSSLDEHMTVGEIVDYLRSHEVVAAGVRAKG